MEQIVDLLQQHKQFIIAGHVGPDEDTIGSCFALAMALGKLGKEAVVVLESYAERHKIIPGWEYLYRNASPQRPYVFVAMDCADVERLGPARGFFKKAKTTICIDHHETNEGFADYNYIDPEASSTSEMVFGIVKSLVEMDTDIAAALYAGIVADTGGFKYVSTSRSTMEIAARLMGTGIPFTEIYSEVMHRHSFAGAKAFGLALEVSKQAMDGRIVYAYMTKEMLAAVGADSSDLDNIVEYLRDTRGADVALFLYERHQSVKEDVREVDEPLSDEMGTALLSEEASSSAAEALSANETCANGIDAESNVHRKIKVSMRSRGLDIGRIAASLGGGGHRLAAGCTMVGTMDEVLRQMLDVLERELKVLDIERA